MKGHMEQNLLDAIRELVSDLADGRFLEIETSGRAGRLTACELATAIHEYGRKLLPLPDRALPLLDVHPNHIDPRMCSIDVPLWTTEEGRSDLTLSLVATKASDGYRLQITDLRVM